MPIGHQKVPIERLFIEKKISDIMKNSIVHLYNELDDNQVFGRREVSKMLKCSERNAGSIISLMRTLEIIESVKGKGKGKYIFRMIYDK